jgi:hypothetical protein
LPSNDAADKAGHPGIDVNHGAARKVQRTPVPDQPVRGKVRSGGFGPSGIARSLGNQLERLLFGQEVRTTPPPDHMGHREVDEGHPQHR